MSDDRLVNSWQIANSQRRGNKGWERKVKESLEESANYSNIPLVDSLSYYNNKLNRLPGLDVAELVKTLDKIAEYFGPKFKIRSTKFGRNISWGDIKDEWMSLRRNGWSISQDYDSSLPGFNEVYICSKIANNESLTEEAHETLNQDLWDENNKLKPEVKEKLDLIVEKFKERLKEDGVDINVDDVVLVGSNANYNYTDKSDIDLHLIADLSIYKDKEDLAQVVYNAYRRLFNDKFDPMIYGHEVELYVEPKEEVEDTMKIKPLESLNEDTEEYYVLAISDRGGNSDYIKGPMTKEEATEYAKILRKDASKYYRERYLVYPKNRIPGRYKHLLSNESLNESTANSNGVYSLYNGWLKEPIRDDIPNVELEPELSEWKEKAEGARGSIEDIEKFLNDVYVLRQDSILKEGEFGKGNLIFKQLRNEGILQSLKDLKVTLENKAMSLPDDGIDAKINADDDFKLHDLVY